MRSSSERILALGETSTAPSPSGQRLGRAVQRCGAPRKRPGPLLGSCERPGRCRGRFTDPAFGAGMAARRARACPRRGRFWARARRSRQGHTASPGSEAAAGDLLPRRLNAGARALSRADHRLCAADRRGRQDRRRGRQRTRRSAMLMHRSRAQERKARYSQLFLRPRHPDPARALRSCATRNGL